MDFMKMINDLRAEKTGLLAQIETVEDEAKLGEIADRMEAINASIANYERLARESQGSAQPVENAPQNAGKMTAEDRRAKAVKDLASAARQGFKVTTLPALSTPPTAVMLCPKISRLRSTTPVQKFPLCWMRLP